MFIRTISLASKQINIDISVDPKILYKDVHIFGYPLIEGDEFDTLDYNNIKGVWCLIELNENYVKIVSDITGGFRLYTTIIEEKIFISDNPKKLLKIVYDESVFKVNNFELEFWDKHRFTTGGNTFITHINKIKPCSITLIDKHNWKENIYFKSINREVDVNRHTNIIYDDLINTFNKIKEKKTLKILFFSGGIDSTLLVKMCQKVKIDFVPIYLIDEKPTKVALDDLKRAKYIASKLNIHLEIMEYSPNVKNNIDEEIIDNQLFDRHYSYLHYYGLKKIVEKYGQNITVINGQSSDSILSFGPTSGIISYLSRYTLYKNDLVSYFSAYILGYKYKEKYSIPNSVNEKLIAFIDECNYVFLKKNNISSEYINYLLDLIDSIGIENITTESQLMYLKIYGFIQGSDNQVVINSAKLMNIESIIMPFATPPIIYATVKYKSDNLDIKSPKYSIKRILKTYFKFRYEYSPDSIFNILIKKINNRSQEDDFGIEEKIKRYVYTNMSITKIN